MEVLVQDPPEPAFGEPLSPYNDHLHEIEHRVPIIDSVAITNVQNYSHDNIQVWKLLWSVVKDTQWVTYIKPFVAKQDGRRAFTTLYVTLLGPESIGNHASMAENALNKLAYDGNRKKNWNFEKYIVGHREQHLILTKLTEFGHSGIDETSKIRQFLQGITDPKLEVVKSTLCANDKSAFDATIAVYRRFMEASKTINPKRDQQLNVSQLQSGNNPMPSDGTPESYSLRQGSTQRTSVLDRYKREELWRSSPVVVVPMLSNCLCGGTSMLWCDIFISSRSPCSRTWLPQCSTMARSHSYPRSGYR